MTTVDHIWSRSPVTAPPDQGLIHCHILSRSCHILPLSCRAAVPQAKADENKM